MSARNSIRAQRGLSIIELMVGIVVSLLVGLAASTSAIMFNASQRSGIGTGGVSLSAGSALAALKNDAALAGLGFFGESAFMCETLALSVGTGLVVDGGNFTPISITTEEVGDRVDIVYADRVEAGASVLLETTSDGTEASVMSLLPATAGQAVLLAPAAPGGTCLVRTVTAVTDSTDTTPQVLTFADTGTHNKAAFAVAPTFAARDRMTLLGALHWNRYRRVDNTLVLERPLDGTTAVIARDVIGLRAQYGISSNAAGSTTLEAWQDAADDFATLDATTLPRVRALRLGIVTRSTQREKPDADGNCEASLAKPQLFGVTVEPDVADWRCYRYRSSIVVVPLRNLVLGLRG
jgi:type IV pilus assembly protein PilW